MTRDVPPPKLSPTEAQRRLQELWQWAVLTNRPFLAYLIGTAVLAFDMDDGKGGFEPPGLEQNLSPILPPKPARGRPPKV